VRVAPPRARGVALERVARRRRPLRSVRARRGRRRRHRRRSGRRCHGYSAGQEHGARQVLAAAGGRDCASRLSSCSSSSPLPSSLRHLRTTHRAARDQAYHQPTDTLKGLIPRAHEDVREEKERSPGRRRRRRRRWSLAASAPWLWHLRSPTWQPRTRKPRHSVPR